MKQQYPLTMEKELLEKLRGEAKELDIPLNSYLKIKILNKKTESEPRSNETPSDTLNVQNG